MDKICAFFDAQWFYINRRFLPREVACLSGQSTIHFSVNHGMKSSEIPTDRLWSIQTEGNEINGLPFGCNVQGLLIHQARILIYPFYVSSPTRDPYWIHHRWGWENPAETGHPSNKGPDINYSWRPTLSNSSKWHQIQMCFKKFYKYENSFW